jgi:lantibiotic biosynthesis protein
MTTPTTSRTTADRGEPFIFDSADATRQSLAVGTPGIALQHLERARTGTGPWADAYAQIQAAATGPVDGGDHASLYYGAPALAFLLDRAARADDRYQAAAATLEHHIIRLTQRRLAAANARMHNGGAASLAEYDLFHGLTGIGALLLQRVPGSDTFADLLTYLTKLTCPRMYDSLSVPGWWADHDPDPTLPTPGGHANFGMAHGAAGILALLALAVRSGCMVEHHIEAIERLKSWFDRWRQHDANGDPWWPQWLTPSELQTGTINQLEPGRPSWCYGTPGIARALQLAAIATDDPARRADAEDALKRSLTDRHLRRLTDLGLCHGLAGVYQTAYRAANDAQSHNLRDRLPALATAMKTSLQTLDPVGPGGLLTGHAGILLAADTAHHGTTLTGWDTCLLIT